MRMTLFPLFILLSAFLPGCTSYLPAARLPVPATVQQSVKVVSIPLPVIATSPNEGVTYGALTAFLLHNDKDEVCTLIAPQLNRNDNFGTTGTIYGAFYPSPPRSFEMNLSKSSHVNQDYELRMRDQSLMGQKLEVNAFVYTFTDGSARFFGLGSSSPETSETNFGAKEYGITVSAGYPIFDRTQLFVGERFRQVRIVRGAVQKLPFLLDLYSPEQIPGSDRFITHAQMLSLVYSTLDTAFIPVSGVRARLTVEASFDELGSSSNYRHYEAEVKGLYPVRDARFISVGRLAYSQSRGDAVPFLERSALGGETTLRGYGRNRFIDSSYILLNLEERIRLFRWEVFGVRADWELAPFIDIGGVMKSLADLRGSDLEVNPGLGFRAIVRPNIVGRIDVGFSREGPAVFVGLGYPF
jgi:outer membrane protein assembly factor BamA